MALIAFGGGITDARGSIGGSTISRSGAGATMRARRKGVSPNTSYQATRKAHTSYIADAWSGTLDATERASWAAAAASISWVNKLGQSIALTGFQLFFRLNSLMLLAGKALVEAGPTAMGSAVSPLATITADASDGNISIAEPSQGFAKSTVGEHLLVSVCTPQRPGTTTGAKGKRFLQVIDGAATPPTFPVAITLPFDVNAGEIVTVELIHIDADNRVSAPYTARVTVAA